jgi:flagellar biosynthetic protein FliO
MEVLQQFVIVLIVLCLLCGALWVLKRKGWARTGLRRRRDEGTPRLEVVDRLPLTQHHSLHLVRLADRTLLIGLSPNGCNLLESAQIALSSAVRQEN